MSTVAESVKNRLKLTRISLGIDELEQKEEDEKRKQKEYDDWIKEHGKDLKIGNYEKTELKFTLDFDELIRKTEELKIKLEDEESDDENYINKDVDYDLLDTNDINFYQPYFYRDIKKVPLLEINRLKSMTSELIEEKIKIRRERIYNEYVKKYGRHISIEDLKKNTYDL